MEGQQHPGAEEGAGALVEAGGYRGPDRRRRPTPILSRYSFWGGRRREAGDSPGFVDVYSFRAWVLLNLFLALNLLDGHFTLLFLQRGGQEANPVAVWLLDQGMGVFLGVKGLGVGLGAALFCVLKNFPNARKGVVIVLGFYAALLVYHLVLAFGSSLG